MENQFSSPANFELELLPEQNDTRLSNGWYLYWGIDDMKVLKHVKLCMKTFENDTWDYNWTKPHFNEVLVKEDCNLWFAFKHLEDLLMFQLLRSDL